MDKVDGKILMQLQQDAKQNTKQIANKIGLSVTPTYERIRKMERSGIIKSYVALLDRSKIEKEVVAYCQITLSKHQKSTVDSFERKMNSIPEIMECHHVSGNFDFLLKVVASNINEFHKFTTEKLSVFEEIATIHTVFVMKSAKDSTVYNVDLT
ncbi:MAG: Lrp/AsnC family transcriptional regulator [Flavobacteriaceae bacterium]|jgi:Lrp/AsnC family leucine-responsive transcriptional regulator|nr:Lrp/AsnC family transcriptional regulator [Flavobacteriaceae bacterium]